MSNFVISLFFVCASAANILGSSTHPILIAHRGDSKLYPEHSSLAYISAIKNGVDYIEVDLHPTKDGHLISIHDFFLSSSTDVRKYREKLKDSHREQFNYKGYVVEDDWLIADLTLEQIKMLRVNQRGEDRSHQYDGLFQIMTFEEIIDLADRYGVKIYAEIKGYGFYMEEFGIDTVNLFSKTISAQNPKTLMIFESFELAAIQKLKQQMTILCVFLLKSQEFKIDFDYLVEQQIDAIGLEITFFEDQQIGKQIVNEAHSNGIAVHVWTIVEDHPLLLKTTDQEFEYLSEIGIDGFFIENTQNAKENLFKQL